MSRAQNHCNSPHKKCLTYNRTIRSGLSINLSVNRGIVSQSVSRTTREQCQHNAISATVWVKSTQTPRDLIEEKNRINYKLNRIWAKIFLQTFWEYSGLSNQCFLCSCFWWNRTGIMSSVDRIHSCGNICTLRTAWECISGRDEQSSDAMSGWSDADLVLDITAQLHHQCWPHVCARVWLLIAFYVCLYFTFDYTLFYLLLIMLM